LKNTASFLPQAGRERADRFLACLADASRDPGEKEIHDLRVSIRRLLSFLDVAASLSERDAQPGRETERIRKLMRPLGRLRDAQVKIEWLKRIVPTGDEGTRLYALSVVGDAEKWEGRVREILEGTAVRRAGTRIRNRKFPDIEESRLGKKAAALLSARRKKVESFRARAREEGDVESLHRMRLAFKKYRYSAEVLAPLFSRATARTMRRLHAFQTLLGNLHDFDVLLAEADAFRRRILGTENEIVLLPRLRVLRHREFSRLAPLLSTPEAFSTRVFGTEFPAG
jgi:CHAD domain-containing protein